MKRFFFFVLLSAPVLLKAQCNGHPELCSRPYNQVSFLTTHNAYNAEESGFTLPNQTYGLTRQLEDGVRGLMLDVYNEGGVATVYHGFAFLGTTTLDSNLSEIKNFMDANPNEVVTIIFECYISSSMMNDAFMEVGLLPYVHSQTLGEPWPTLQEMIDSGRRLVVLTDKNNAMPGQTWYHYVWNFAVETHFTNHDPGDFSCDFNRGDGENDLFIVNHFVTQATVGTGLPDQAAVVNELSFFYERVKDCQDEHQKFPNFPTVDFYELGHTMTVVDSLNGIQSSVGINSPLESESLSVFPNPSAGNFHVTVGPELEAASYRIYHSSGKGIQTGKLTSINQKLNITDEPDGVYYLVLENDKLTRAFRIIKLNSAASRH